MTLAMHDVQQSTRFDALEKATTAAGIATSLVIRVPELCFLNALPTWFSEARSPRVPLPRVVGP